MRFPGVRPAGPAWLRRTRPAGATPLRGGRPPILLRSPSPEPTPWATGLTVTAIVAAVSIGTDLVLALTLRSTYGWLWVPANVVLCAGLWPTVWLLRNTPVWRWVSYGIAIGFACAWSVLAIVVFSSAAVPAAVTAGS